MIQNIGKTLFLLLVSSFLYACEDELKQEQGMKTDEEIIFSVKDSVWNTPANSGSATRACQMHRQFLGLMEKDSVFITLTEEENDSPNMAGAEHGMQTRGEYVVDKEFSSFHVKALMDFNNTTPVWVEDAEIYRPANGGYWSGDIYWPKGGYTLHFFAHAWNVWEEEGTPVTPQYAVTGTAGNRTYKGEFSYQLPEPQTAEQSSRVNDAARQADLIFAIAPEQTQANSGEAIEMKFFHALAAVRFKFGTLPDDVEVADATLSLGEVINGGSCTFDSPLDEGADFSWTLGDDRKAYTVEGFEGKAETDETFMLPPQDVTTDVVMKLSMKIGEKWYNYEKNLDDFSSTIPKWEANKRYTYTISVSEYVEVSIEETLTQTVKSNVRIQNTGLTTSYIRAAIVGYWENEEGTRIISSWDIEDETTGEFVKDANWSEYWAVGDDGFFYHKTPVKPGKYTGVPLFDKYELKSAGPETGAKLIINIATQAVSKDMAAKAWGSIPAE